MIGILVTVMLVAASGYYVWQSGSPASSKNGNGSFDKAGAVKTLQAAMDQYKAMGDHPSESAWTEFSDKTSTEISALFKSVYERAGATPSGASCLNAAKCLLKIASTKPGNKELTEKQISEFDRQLLLVNK